MIKILINGQEIQLPDELKPIVENMVKSNLDKISEQVNQQVKQIRIQPFPFMHPRLGLREIISQRRSPIEDIFKDIGLEMDKPTTPNFPHRGRIAMAVFDIAEKVRALEKRVMNIEDILIRKQLEKEKLNIKPTPVPIQKKLTIKPIVKPVITTKPIVKKPVPVKKVIPIKKQTPIVNIKEKDKQVVKKVVTTKPIIKKPVPVKKVIKRSNK